MKNNKFFMGGIAAAVLLCVTGCDLYTASDTKGNLTIIFGSGETRQSVSRSVNKPSAEVQEVLDYTLTFTGPGGQGFVYTIPAGTSSIRLSLALGNWHVLAEARMPGNIYVGSGEKQFTVAPGNNQVTIPMTASGIFYEITIDPAINCTVSTPFSAVFAGTTVTLTVTPDNATWYTVGSANITVSGASPAISGSDGVFTFTMPAADISISAAAIEKYAPGDTGPAGGKIFYVNSSPADWKYMECTTAAIPGSPANAGNNGSGIPGTEYGSPDFGENIGRGKDNTRIILEYYPTVPFPTTGLAAQLCDDYSVTVGGILYDDWFLPSLNELFEIAANSGLTFSGAQAWSSTKDGAGYSWYVIMNTTSRGGYWDGNPFDVYAARRF